jgi:beta-mannanase
VETLAASPASADLTASGLLPPDVLFGAWVPGGQTAVRALQRRLGRKLDIVHWYQSWSPPSAANLLDSTRAQQVASAGGVPMITWEPWTAQPSRIAEGHFDGYLRQNARALRSVPGMVWLRFGHEMNLGIYPWSVGNGTTGKEYVAAWRRIVRVFREQGALNVRYVWAPNVLTPDTTPLHRVWPGNEYVDYVGMDGYNWRTSWKPLPDIFGPLYDELRRLTTLPVVITEVACAEAGGDRAAWIQQAFAEDLARHFPAVVGVAWFNEKKEADWRLNGNPSTLEAAREVFDRPPYVSLVPL